MPPNDPPIIAPIILPYAHTIPTRSLPAKIAITCSITALFVGLGVFSGLLNLRRANFWMLYGLSALGSAGAVVGAIAVIQCIRFPSKYTGKTLAILAILIGVPGTTIPAWSPPFVYCCIPISTKTVCASNLRAILQAMKIYANENNDAYPPDLNMLIANGDLIAKQFTCPESGKSNYVFIPGLTEESPPNVPVLFEPIANHGNGGIVAFIDGSVRFVIQPEYDQLLAPHLGTSPIAVRTDVP